MKDIRSQKCGGIDTQPISDILQFIKRAKSGNSLLKWRNIVKNQRNADR